MTETPQESPARAVTGMVGHVLEMAAATWTNRPGKPVHVDDRVHTPHKAIRRVVDHLAEPEVRPAGEKPQPDAWQASAVTTSSTTRPA
ncbi:hypothetical protein ACWCRD_00815 [Streptomyces sp. NPDC002092]